MSRTNEAAVQLLRAQELDQIVTALQAHHKIHDKTVSTLRIHADAQLDLADKLQRCKNIATAAQQRASVAVVIAVAALLLQIAGWLP